MIDLVLCKRTDREYQEIRDRHYVANHGTIGRQLHYKVYRDGSLAGIITGASPVWSCKPRDDFFSISKENRKDKLDEIVCNTVFRLELREQNLGSMVLAQWRKKIKIDWFNKYGYTIKGFETFIYGENRFGSLYKADNWIYVGDTKGNTKLKRYGMNGYTERISTDIKMIFVKNI